MKLLNVPEAGHRVNSTDCPLNNENWKRNHSHQWQFQRYIKFKDINDIIYFNKIQCKIKDINYSELKKLRNDLIFFYTLNKNEITTVSI